MAALPNPALTAFVASFGDETVLAQVFIARRGGGFGLRHVADRDAAEESLREVAVGDLRDLAQTTNGGAFRPNKAAPSLRCGWFAVAGSPVELEDALRQLYPGALADWFAVQQPAPPVTHFREFLNRQTGMYRATQLLDDERAAEVIRAGCDARFCLRRRLWTVPGLEPDPADAKSLIPCLEPCVLMLDLARHAQRLSGGPAVELALAEDDVRTLLHALDSTLAQPGSDVREGETGVPENPRRLALLRERLRAVMPPAPPETAG